MFRFKSVVKGQDILLKYACAAHICVHVRGSEICFLEEEHPSLWMIVFISQ